MGRLTQPGQNVLLAGPDTQSRNAFKYSKGIERKRGGWEKRRRDGGREEKRRNESRGDMCLTLRNSSGSNLHIYDCSPE